MVPNGKRGPSHVVLLHGVCFFLLACALSRWLSKRSGGRKFRNIGGSIGRLKTWKRRWFVVKDTFVAYYTTPRSTKAVDVIMFDNKMSVDYGVEVCV